MEGRERACAKQRRAHRQLLFSIREESAVAWLRRVEEFGAGRSERAREEEEEGGGEEEWKRGRRGAMKKKEKGVVDWKALLRIERCALLLLEEHAE